MAELHFDITGDNEQLLKAIDGAMKGVQQMNRRVEKEGGDIDKTFQKISAAAAKMGVAFSAQQFISQVVKVRGEMQQLEVAFNTMLGSEQKANALMEQLVKTAATTPFDLQGVANGAKQLLAYGEDVDKVNEDLIRLGNIAAGLSQPLGDIVYLYGTTMTQGRLYTQDLNQFTGRGIPMIRELAKQFGVAESEVKGLVEEGKVGFPEVQKVIESLTNEGGMFHDLMQEQSKTITGQISNLEDSVQMMFNEIGKAGEGAISGAISVASELVDNYEKVGQVLMSLVASYGAYKAAVIAVTVSKSGMTAAELAHYGALVATEKAQKLLNATMLKNPYVLAATALVALVGALATFGNETARIERIQKKYNNELEKSVEAHNKAAAETNKLINITKDESSSTEERRLALVRLSKQYPDILAKYATEAEALEHIADIQREINKLIAERDPSSTKNQLANVEKQITELESRRAEVVRRQQGKGSSKEYEGQVLSWKRDDEAQLKALKSKRGELKKQSHTEDVEQYLANLDDYTDEELQKMLERRQTAAKKLQNRNILQPMDPLLESEVKFPFEAMTEGAEQTATAVENVAKASKQAGEGISEYIKAADKAAGTDTADIKDMEMIAGATEEELKAQADIIQKEINKRNNPAKLTKEQQKEADKRKKIQKDLNKDLKDLQEKNNEASVERLNDGFAKRLEVLRLEKEKELRANEELAAEWKTQNAKAGVTGTNENGLTDEQQTAIDTNKNLIEQTYEQKRTEEHKAHAAEEKALQDEIAANFLSNEKQKIAAINKTYEEQKQKLQALRDGGSITSDTYDTSLETLNTAKMAQEQQVYLDEFGNYEQKRAALVKEWEARIAAIPVEYQQQAREKMSAELFAMDTEASEAYALIFGNIATMTQQQINQAIELAKAELARLKEAGASDDVISQMSGKVADLSKAGQQAGEAWRGGFSTSFTSLGYQMIDIQKQKAAIQTATDAGADEETLGKMNEELNGMQTNMQQTFIAAGANALSSAIGNCSSSLIELGEISGDESMTNAGEQLEAVGELMSSTAEGFASGGWIGAIIGAASSILEQTIEAITGAAKAQAQMIAEREDFLELVHDNELKVNEEDYDTLFGTNSLTKAKDAYSVAQQALSEYKAAVETPMEMPEYEDEFNSLGAAIFLPMIGGEVGWGRTATNRYKQQMAAYEQGLSELQGMSINTTNYGGWAKFWGAKDEYQSLADYAPELWDENGEFVVENAEAFLETNTQLTAEQEEQIQNAIDLKKAYDEAIEAVDEVISEYTSDITSNLADSIFEAIDEGSDAWDIFEEKAGDVIRSLGKQMLQEMMYSMLFEDYTDDLRAAFGGGDTAEISKLLAEMFDNAQASMPLFQSAAEEWQTMADELGYGKNSDNTTDTEDQEATTGGFENMSQESAEELNGRFTALQITGEDIKSRMTEAVTSMTSMSLIMTASNTILGNILTQQVLANGYLEDITTNTKPLLQFGTKLDKIATNTNALVTR